MRSLHPVLKKWLSFIVVLALALSLAPGASALAPAKDLTDPEPTRTYNFYVDLNWKQTQVVKNGDIKERPLERCRERRPPHGGVAADGVRSE